MAGEDDGGTTRACTSCGAALPDGRSVCPGCGTLQPAPPGSGPAGPVPVAIPAPPATTAAAPGSRPRRRKPVLVAAAVIAVLAIGAGAALLLTDDDDGQSADAVREVDDPRVAAIRGFCDDPRPLPTTGSAYEPGGPAVAYVAVPQPASSTQAERSVTVQVAPAVGSARLPLDGAAALVSLAVCVDQRSSERTGNLCDYELTNVDSLGERQTARLLLTRYDVEVRSLRTGKVVADGTLSTPVDVCPELAYLDPGEGVSNPLSEAQLLAWVADELPSA